MTRSSSTGTVRAMFDSVGVSCSLESAHSDKSPRPDHFVASISSSDTDTSCGCARSAMKAMRAVPFRRPRMTSPFEIVAAAGSAGRTTRCRPVALLLPRRRNAQ